MQPFMQPFIHHFSKRRRTMVSACLALYLFLLGTPVLFAAEEPTQSIVGIDQLGPMLVGGFSMAIIMIFLVWLTLREGRNKTS